MRSISSCHAPNHGALPKRFFPSRNRGPPITSLARPPLFGRSAFRRFAHVTLELPTPQADALPVEGSESIEPLLRPSMRRRDWSP